MTQEEGMKGNVTNKETAKAGRGRPREFDREKALCKALELFWEQGYMQTTMAQLCAAMQIKSPSLYCAFGCKADLFLEAITYYRRLYWHDAFSNFLHSESIYTGTRELFAETARILLLPRAPCGCLTVFSALTLPASEKRILNKITEMRNETRNVFRKRIMRGVEEGELSRDVNIETLGGALTNFFEGLTLQARDKRLCFDELKEIALLGVALLPPQNLKKQ